MSTQVPSISTTPKVSGPEIPHSDQMLEPTKGRIGLHDLDVALDRFEDEALGQFQNLSFEDRRIYEKHIDRYVIKLRREFFYLCNNGVHADLIREKFMASLANYQSILKEFKAGNLAYQTAYNKETHHNVDLKTRITNAFLQNVDWAFCDGIPPAIDYDKIPPATQQFSLDSPSSISSKSTPAKRPRISLTKPCAIGKGRPPYWPHLNERSISRISMTLKRICSGR